MRTEKIASMKRMLGKKGMGFAVVGIIVGIILLLMPTNEKETSQELTAKQTISSVEYVSLLEEKAVGLIKEIDGVDDCKVFITLERGFRYVYATDQHVKEATSSKETDKTIVLANQSGGETPILIEETMPDVAGVAVVCKGASYETQYRIIETMCALFDIKSNRITVQS